MQFLPTSSQPFPTLDICKVPRDPGVRMKKKNRSSSCTQRNSHSPDPPRLSCRRSHPSGMLDPYNETSWALKPWSRIPRPARLRYLDRRPPSPLPNFQPVSPPHLCICIYFYMMCIPVDTYRKDRVPRKHWLGGLGACLMGYPLFNEDMGWGWDGME